MGKYVSIKVYVNTKRMIEEDIKEDFLKNNPHMIGVPLSIDYFVRRMIFDCLGIPYTKENIQRYYERR